MLTDSVFLDELELIIFSFKKNNLLNATFLLATKDAIWASVA